MPIHLALLLLADSYVIVCKISCWPCILHAVVVLLAGSASSVLCMVSEGNAAVPQFHALLVRWIAIDCLHWRANMHVANGAVMAGDQQLWQCLVPEA